MSSSGWSWATSNTHDPFFVVIILVDYPGLEQGYVANGVRKNDATSCSFKKAVRIVNKPRNEREDSGVSSARAMTSFLIENLIWNVPDEIFGAQGNSSIGLGSLTILSGVRPLHAMTLAVLSYLHACTRDGSLVSVACSGSGWTAENGIKPLFHDSQSWPRAQANQFLQDALDYIQSG